MASAFCAAYDGFYDMLLDGTTLITVSAVLLAAFWLVLGVFGILRSMALRRRYLLDRSYRPTPEIRKRKHVRAVLASLICLSVLPLVVLYLAEGAIPVDVPFPECPVALLESLSPEGGTAGLRSGKHQRAPCLLRQVPAVFLRHLPARRPHYLAGGSVCRDGLSRLQLLGHHQGYPHRITVREILRRKAGRPRLAGGADQRLGSGRVPPVLHRSPAGVPQQSSAGDPRHAAAGAAAAAGQSRCHGRLYRRDRHVPPLNALYGLRKADVSA